MSTLGQCLTETELQDMINQVDIDQNGTIDFTEFLTCMLAKMNEEDTEEDLKEAFKIFDWDGNELISKEELKNAMESLGESLTDTELDDLIK